MAFFRTLLFWILMIPITVILTLLGLLSALAPSYLLRYKTITFWSKCFIFLSQHVLKIKYKINGLEGVNLNEPAIVASNHQSAWEAVFFQCLFPPQTWVLKRQLLWIPVFGWGLALLKPIAIERKTKVGAIQQVLETGEKRLKTGIWVIVFPEGSRIIPGETAKKWGKSFAILSQKTGVKVIPVNHNAGEHWKKRRFCKKPGVITITIGPPISPAGRDANDIFVQTKTWIESQKPLKNP